MSGKDGFQGGDMGCCDFIVSLNVLYCVKNQKTAIQRHVHILRSLQLCRRLLSLDQVGQPQVRGARH